MRNLIYLSITTALTAAAAFAAFGDIVSSFPVPAELSGCDGLTWDGAYLWGCAEGRSYVYRLTTTGSIVSSFNTGGGVYYESKLTGEDGTVSFAGVPAFTGGKLTAWKHNYVPKWYDVNVPGE